MVAIFCMNFACFSFQWITYIAKATGYILGKLTVHYLHVIMNLYFFTVLVGDHEHLRVFGITWICDILWKHHSIVRRVPILKSKHILNIWLLRWLYIPTVYFNFQKRTTKHLLIKYQVMTVILLYFKGIFQCLLFVFL